MIISTLKTKMGLKEFLEQKENLFQKADLKIPSF